MPSSITSAPPPIFAPRAANERRTVAIHDKNRQASTGCPKIRLRDLATAVGITERAAHRIVVELEDGGYISRERSGRRNHYEIHPEVPLRHPIERHRTVAALIALLRNERRKS